MPKVNDIKAYWKDIATKAGLSEDQQKQAEALMGNDQFAKAFQEGFKPLPDYSHDLDDVRNRTKAETDQGYREWYEKEQQKYNQWVQDLNELEELRKGSRIPNLNNGHSPALTGEPKAMTQEEIDKLVDARMSTMLNDTLTRRDRAVLDLLEVREFHMGKFSKPLDVDAFEKSWKEHPEWGGSLKIAYKNFVEPEIKKQEEEMWNAKLEQKYQDGIRDGFSRKNIPTDNMPKIFSPMFDRKDDVAKMTPGDQERHSREAFFEGLREKSTA